MPTVLEVGPYAFRIYTREPNEPPHVHIVPDEKMVKVWLTPPRMANNHGFDGHEVRKIIRLVKKDYDLLLEKWHELHP